MNAAHNDKTEKIRSDKGKALHRLHAVLGLLFAAVFLAFAVISYLDPLRAQRIKVFLGLADAPASSAEMSVHFVDVGQGDCELIICGGEACLIDCGEQDMGGRVSSYLKAQEITKIKYFIISHQHTDHMGGAERIMKDFDIDCIIMPQIPDELIPTNSVYDSFLDALDSSDIEVYEAQDQVLGLGGCELYIYPQDHNEEYITLNNYSLCVKAVYGDTSFLFTGDAEREEELMLGNSGIDLSADVIKAGHHGSSGSNTYELLNKVKAKYAVIEVGAGNEYGHPSRSAIKRLKNCGMQIYRTDEDGTVVFESDGNGLSILTDRE